MLEHRSLSEQVVEELGQRIVSGRYAIGEVLPTEDVLCDELGVSRTVVREATKVLAAKGLIQPLRKIGTQVQPRLCWKLLDEAVQKWEYAVGGTEKLLRNVTEVRQIIEPEACYFAAQRASTDDIEKIEQAYRDMESVVDDPQAFVVADIRFHITILNASHNELLVQLGTMMRQSMLASYQTTTRVPDGLTNALPFHRQIVEAIRDHDAEAARQHMQVLIERARQDIDSVLGGTGID